VSSRRPLLIVLALVAALAGGCADGKVKEANTYVNAVNEAQTTFAAASDKLIAEITPNSSRKHDVGVLDRFYAAVDTFVARLRQIKPPARVRSLHDKLTTAMVRFGTDLRSAGADIISGNAGRILDGQAKLGVATRDVSHAINSTVADINAALKR
jgi:hypothetical protein